MGDASRYDDLYFPREDCMSIGTYACVDFNVLQALGLSGCLFLRATHVTRCWKTH